jgi:site-specific recombinase XerD
MTDTNQLIPSPAPAVLLAPFFGPTPEAMKRVRDFFTAHLQNDHTRKAYKNATECFAAWCEARGIVELSAVEPFHVAAFLRHLQDKDHQPKPSPHPRSSSTSRRGACCSTGW